MKPNIFDFATKELTQDAFLTWLLSYADENNRQYDKKLHLCAQQFIKELLVAQMPKFNEEIISVIAGRQHKNIDVWVKVNNQYFIIIEDKTNTQQHDNQLERYKQIANEWCLLNNYKPAICIYIKTGNESQPSLKPVTAAGYSIYNRINLVTLLNNHPEITNEIFIDFKERLIRIESDNNLFIGKPLGSWVGTDWQGYFQLLEKEMGIVNWNFVNNQAKGFWNAVLNWEKWNSYPVYMQLEEGKLCFKISTNPKDAVVMPANVTRGQIRNKLSNLLLSKAKEAGINHLRKPNRFGNGKYMTVAIIDRHNWMGSKDSIIDTKEIIKTLKFYKNFLLSVIN